MKPIQNPLRYAEDFYFRMTGENIWRVLKNKWGRNLTQNNWYILKKSASPTVSIATQIEKILGKEVITAEDIIGVENANNSIFKTECLIMQRIKNERSN